MVGLSATKGVKGNIDHNYTTTQVKMIKGMKFFWINVRPIFQGGKTVVLNNIVVIYCDDHKMCKIFSDLSRQINIGTFPLKTHEGWMSVQGTGICFFLLGEISSELWNKYNHRKFWGLIHQVCESRKSSISWYFSRLGNGEESSSSLLDSLKLAQTQN